MLGCQTSDVPAMKNAIAVSTAASTSPTTIAEQAFRDLAAVGPLIARGGVAVVQMQALLDAAHGATPIR